MRKKIWLGIEVVAWVMFFVIIAMAWLSGFGDGASWGMWLPICVIVGGVAHSRRGGTDWGGIY